MCVCVCVYVCARVCVYVCVAVCVAVCVCVFRVRGNQALLLADGKRLITQVVPQPLLQQTRDVLRARFATVVRKPVLTLLFDRSSAIASDAEQGRVGFQQPAVPCC